jgi:hypothetical protein
MEGDPITVWMCQIETNNTEHCWQTECAFPRLSIEDAVDKAASIIKNDLWPNSETLTLDDIKSKLASSSPVEFNDTAQIFSTIKVTFWQTTNQD